MLILGVISRLALCCGVLSSTSALDRTSGDVRCVSLFSAWPMSSSASAAAVICGDFPGSIWSAIPSTKLPAGFYQAIERQEL